MKIVKTWFVAIAVFVGYVFLVPFAALAITTQPATSLTAVAQGVIAYDACTVRVVSGNTLAGAGVCGLSAPTFGPSAGLDAAKNTSLVHVGERGVIQQGEFVNRVFDSRYRELGSEVSGPLGRSFTPGSGVPTTAAEATSQRGLGIYYPNNAQEAIIYRAKSDIPTINRTSLGGTAPESLIDRQYWDQLEVIRQFSLPGGTP